MFAISCKSTDSYGSIDVTFQKPNVSDNGTIIGVNWDFTTVKQVIQITYCPDVVDSILTKPKHQNATYNEVAQVQCLSGLPLFKGAYGSLAMRKSPGRAITYTCGAHAEWEGPDVECWKGQTVDIQNSESRPFILALNTPTLFFCDVTGKDNYDVIMTVGTQRFSQKNNVAAILTPSVDDFNKTVECYSQRNISSKRQVPLWFLFPPQLLNRQTFVHYLCVGDASTAIVTFRSNPPITECGKVRVNKQGKSFTSFVLQSSGVTNFIKFIFPKLSKSDLGYYDVMVTSCEPVFSNKTIHIEIKECSTPVAVVTVHKPDSRITIGLSTVCACLVLLLLIAVTCIAVKRRNNAPHSSEQPRSQTPCRPAIPNASNSCNEYRQQQSADYCVISDRRGYVNMPLPGAQQSQNDPRFQGGASLDAGAYESYFIPG
uniref:Uncharacterized LOC100182388 n=1 Tax=Ciona intestinalis TaxID=7719 RepID=F6PT25_CIOIN|nr:uncharacterized protein LOC100182388 isoform X2 [Ciona intestinalis]|eukprot:XP_026691792.1 uncharacterized protein LOC100182388 isoform X2 [Ciona intestinalis]